MSILLPLTMSANITKWVKTASPQPTMSPSTSKKANSALSSALRARENHRAEHAGRYGHLRRRTYLAGRQEVSAYNQRQLTEYRRYDVGFVFQFYNLVQNLTALENVELASEICKEPLPAAETLRQVGLEHRMGNFPAQLSGGEQQRVSIARALAKNPKILLCDEPTGALDYKTGKQVLALLQDTCRSTGRTVIVITHNSALTAMADRVIRIKSGQAISNVVNEHPTPVEEIEW